MNSKSISLVIMVLIVILGTLPIIIGNAKAEKRYDSYSDCKQAMHGITNSEAACRHIYDDYR
ncbi:hypothetical protein ACF3NV_07765 [Moraxella atlantae]|uniref:hypothetical protein n=1 Tax=Faucicola atlantae TaxID=34059 RepID=UPI00375222C8